MLIEIRCPVNNFSYYSCYIFIMVINNSRRSITSFAKSVPESYSSGCRRNPAEISFVPICKSMTSGVFPAISRLVKKPSKCSLSEIVYHLNIQERLPTLASFIILIKIIWCDCTRTSTNKINIIICSVFQFLI